MNKEFKILLVEDTPVAQMLCKKTISMIENTVCDIADDGDKAFEARKKNNYDLILMDIGLPSISGIDATKLIRKHENYNNIDPVIIIGLTAHNNDNTRKKSLEAGMNDFFTKPFTIDKAKMILLKHFKKI